MSPSASQPSGQSSPLAAGASGQPSRREQFTSICHAHERRLYTFILALVPNRVEADEVLQETLLVLWEKFEHFVPGTSFLAWAYAVARLEVLKHRERQARQKRLLSLEAIDAVSAEVQSAGDLLELRHAALAECLRKLTDRQRRIVDERYRAGMSIDALAERLGRTRDAVYQILSRIRRSLQECIDRTLASGSRS